MRKSKIITLILALVWVVSTLPYFASNLISLHGHHKISSEIKDGRLLLVFHHDQQQAGKEKTHHHKHHSGHETSSHEPNSQHPQGDHVANIFTLVATLQFRNAYLLTKSLTYIPCIKIFTALAEVPSIQTPKSYLTTIDIFSEYITCLRSVILHL